MWIKKTRVTTKSGVVTYVQLMETEYVAGRSRQKVVLNLGREESVDLEKAMALARFLSKKTIYDFVDDGLIEVLPYRYYGETFLLMKVFEITSLKRFCSDAAKSRGLEGPVVSTLFALLAFYLLNVDTKRGFFPWLKTYYIPEAAILTPELVGEAFALLRDCTQFHPGVITTFQNLEQTNEAIFAYSFLSEAKGAGRTKALRVEFVLSQDNLPLGYSLSPFVSPRFPSAGPSKITVSNEPRMVRDLHSAPSEGPFISASSLGDFSFPGPWGQQILAFARSEGTFADYKNLGYRAQRFGSLLVVIVRDQAGSGEALNQDSPETRDIVCCSAPLSLDDVLFRYTMLARIQNTVTDFYLPDDLRRTVAWSSPDHWLKSLNHLQYLQLFLCLHLDRRLASVGLDADQAFGILRSAKIVELRHDQVVKLLHSQYTSEQQRILNAIAFS